MENVDDEGNSLQAKIGQQKKLEAALWMLRGENADIYQETTDIWVMFQLHIYVHEKVNVFSKFYFLASRHKHNHVHCFTGLH